MRLLNRIALVTGANNPHGIGAEVARSLAKEGAKVAITYQRLPHNDNESELKTGTAFYAEQRSKPADEVISAITSEGGVAIAREADLADAATPARMFDWVQDELGPVEILVNCAAHYEQFNDSILSVNASVVDTTFGVNVRACILMMQEFVARHRKHTSRYGRMINFSTDAARCFPGQITYAASKAAIESLTRSVAREAGSSGITVNAIAPGPVQTGYISPDAAESLASDLPAGRIGLPQDIAAAVIYLALPSSDWTTGQVLYVAGGHDL
jgi:3-oxoacyl-[acyl-carrier protein] reductase